MAFVLKIQSKSKLTGDREDRVVGVFGFCPVTDVHGFNWEPTFQYPAERKLVSEEWAGLIILDRSAEDFPDEICEAEAGLLSCFDAIDHDDSESAQRCLLSVRSYINHSEQGKYEYLEPEIIRAATLIEFLTAD